MSTNSFPHFINSRPALLQFLSGNEVLRSGVSRRNEATVPSNLETIYLSVSAYLLTLGSYLLQALSASDLSKWMWVQSRHHFSRVSFSQMQKIFGSYLLSNSVNTHPLTEAKYLTAPLRTSLPTYPIPGKLCFYYPKGVCRGMCSWFVHLYFKTLSSFSNKEEQFAYLGKEFDRGAPDQAVVLHGLDLNTMYDLLQWNVEHSPISPQGKTQEQMIALLKLRPAGIYGIYTSSHQTLYIKVSESEHYLFDPSVGILKVSDPVLFKKAMETYLSSHNTSQYIFVDKYSCR